MIAIGARLGDIGPHKVDTHPSGFYQSNRLNSRAEMHDFRKSSKKPSSSNFLSHNMKPDSSKMKDMYQNNPYNEKSFYRQQKGLDPILETEDA